MQMKIEENDRVLFTNDAAFALSKGFTQGAIDAATLQARGKLVSAECKRRIKAVADPDAQLNMLLELGVVAGKLLVDRTSEEQDFYTACVSARDWVKSMRDLVPVIAADPNVDYKLDATWPDVPADAAAMIQAF